MEGAADSVQEGRLKIQRCNTNNFAPNHTQKKFGYTKTVLGKMNRVKKDDTFCLFSKEEIEEDLHSLINNLKIVYEGQLDKLNPGQEEEEGEQEVESPPITEIEDNSKHKCDTKWPATVSRPTTSSGLSIFGSSRTPFKVRDNISYFILGGKTIAHVSDDDSDGDATAAKAKDYFANVGRNMNGVNSGSIDNLDFPISRIAITCPLHKAAFLNQIAKFKLRQLEYFFYYKWVLWTQNEKSCDVKKSVAKPERIIETNLDLKVAAKFIKNKLTPKDGALIFMKLGIIPSRASPRLANGALIRFRVDLNNVYDMFKQILTIVMNDELNLPTELNLPICGVSHRCTNDGYSLITLWLTEYPSPTSKAHTLTERLKDILTAELLESIESAVIIENNTINFKSIYKNIEQKENQGEN